MHMLPNTIGLETNLSAVKGVAPKALAHLKKLGIESVRDLLWHFPTRYEDYTKITKIADLKPEEVLNGKAIRLVAPQYPFAARQKRLAGRVFVVILIDEIGNVIQAKPVCGGYPRAQRRRS